MRRDSSWTWGIILILIGVIFLLDSLRIMHFGYFISTFWPVILIVVGIKIILDKRKAHIISEQEIHESGDVTKSTRDRISESNVFGDIAINVSSDNFLGGTINNVFGDIKLDLSNIKIMQDESQLYISGVFGDITIISNKNYPLKVSANAVIGDLNVKDEKREGFFPNLDFIEESYQQSKHKIFIKSSIVFGSITLY